MRCVGERKTDSELKYVLDFKQVESCYREEESSGKHPNVCGGCHQILPLACKQSCGQGEGM